MGDWRLAIFRQRWYIIEKFDDVSFGYQVTKSVPKNKYNKYRKQWEEMYGRSFEETLEGLQNETNNLDRETTQNGERRSNIDDDVFEYTGKNQEVFGLDKSENKKQQNNINPDESAVSGDENRQGNGTARLTNDPNTRRSKDDTIYDSAIILSLLCHSERCPKGKMRSI